MLQFLGKTSNIQGADMLKIRHQARRSAGYELKDMKNEADINAPESLKKGSDEQLARLIGDEHQDNSSLVLSLIEGVEPTSRSLGILLGLAVFHKNRQTAARATRIIRQQEGEDMAQLAQRFRESASYYYNEAAFFEKYHQEDFDLFDFILTAKMCLWHQGGGGQSAYFVQGHQTLDLTHFAGEVLPPSVSGLHFIKYLSLPASKSFQLEASFPYLQALPIEAVYIENTRLLEFPVVLFQFPKLKTLQIKRGTQRPREPMLVPEQGPFGSDSLEVFQIDGYPIEGENRLGPFPQLRDGKFVKCRMHSLDFLKESRELNLLHASNNEFKSTPAFLSSFSQLEEVDLRENPFEQIELQLSDLPLLKKFDLSIRR